MPKQQRQYALPLRPMAFLRAIRRWLMEDDEVTAALNRMDQTLPGGMEPLPIWAAPELGLTFPLLWMPTSQQATDTSPQWKTRVTSWQRRTRRPRHVRCSRVYGRRHTVLRQATRRT